MFIQVWFLACVAKGCTCGGYLAKSGEPGGADNGPESCPMTFWTRREARNYIKDHSLTGWAPRRMRGPV